MNSVILCAQRDFDHVVVTCNFCAQALVDDMVKSVEPVLRDWEEACRASEPVEISVEDDLNVISNNIIAHTAFGTDREKGKEIYQTQKKYVALLFERLDSGLFWIPGFRY